MKIETLPWAQLAPSVRVDVLQLAANAKPAIRLMSATTSWNLREELRQWATCNGLGAASDDRYTCIARDQVTATRTLAIDISIRPHEFELGLSLGYPTCCCESIRWLGESAIDERAQEIETWVFPGPFVIINPDRYSQGGALLSHLPCAPTCEASFQLASSAIEWIQTRSGDSYPSTEPWATWTETVRRLVN